MTRRNLFIIDIFEDNQYGFYESFATLKLDDTRLAFQKAPKDLMITIFGKEYKTNKLIISDISPFAANFISSNPNLKELPLDSYFEATHNEENANDTSENLTLLDEVLKKFFDVINGARHKFDLRKEQKCLAKISRILCITLPSHIIVNQKRDYYYDNQSFSGNICEIEISSYSILDFFSNCPTNFTLYFKDKETQFNPIILTLSDVLYDEFQKNPNLKTYTFDLDNSKGELAPLLDFLLIKSMVLTTNNIDTILHAAETMKIKPIIEIANSLKKKFEESQIIYDNEEDKINFLIDMQDLLFNLNEDNFDQSLSDLIGLGWFSSIEDIKEFISNLCNAAMYRPKTRKLYVKLISQLKQNELLEHMNTNDFFINFLIKYAISLSRESILICPLIYELYENEKLIDKKTLVRLIYKSIGMIENLTNKKIKAKNGKYTPTYSLIWFLPEMVEEYPIIFDLINYWDLNCVFAQVFSIVKLNLDEFRRDNWSLFKKNRNLMTNSDPFAIVIANDDAEQLQLMSTKISFDFSTKIKMSLFENIEEISLIDYAARHGSINCFKYMLLNGANIRNSTYNYAIIGGSTEIIHIVDNEIGTSILTDVNDPIEIRNIGQQVGTFFIPYGSYQITNIMISVMFKLFSYHFPILIQLETVLISCIIYHRDEVFEWLMNKYLIDGKVLALALCSIASIAYNNIKDFMLIVDSGLFIYSDFKHFDSLLKIIIQKAAENGFSEIISMAVSLYGNDLINYSAIENNQSMRLGHFNNLYGNFLVMKGKTIFSEAAAFGSIKIAKKFWDSFNSISSINFIYAISNSIYHGNFDFAEFVLNLQLFSQENESNDEKALIQTQTNKNSNLNEPKNNINSKNKNDNDNKNDNKNGNDNDNENDNKNENDNDNDNKNDNKNENDNDNKNDNDNDEGGSDTKIVKRNNIVINKTVVKEWILNAIKSCNKGNIMFVESLISKLSTYYKKNGDHISNYIDKDLISTSLLTSTFYNDDHFFAWIINHFISIITSDRIEDCMMQASSYGYLKIVNFCLTTLSYLESSNGKIEGELIIDQERPNYEHKNELHISQKTCKKSMQNAAKYGHHDIILFFIEKIPSLFVQFTNDAFKTALGQSRSLTCRALLSNMSFQPTPELLILSLKSNLIEVVKKILEINHSFDFLNTFTEEGSCLSIASSFSSFEIVQFLLDNYGEIIDPNVRDSNGNTAMICAALHQRLDVIRILFEKFENKLEKWQFNALVPAFYSIINNSMKDLKKSKIDDNFFVYFNPLENNIVIVKSSTNDIDLCHFLLNMFPQQNSSSEFLSSSSSSEFQLDWNFLYNDRTPLMIAAEKNNLSLLQFLLSLDEVDVNARNVKNGDTALLIAAMFDNEVIVDALVNHKRTKIGIENKNGESVLTKSIIPIDLKVNFNQTNNRSSTVIYKVINSPKFSTEISQEQIGEALICAIFSQNIAIFNALLRIPTLDVMHTAKKMIYLSTNNSQINSHRSWKDDSLVLASYFSDDNCDFLAPLLNHNTFDASKCNLQKAAFFSVNKDINTIFQPIINLLAGNVNIIDQESKISLLNIAILSCSSAILPLILTNLNFDKEKSDIDNAISWDFTIMNSENNLVVNTKFGGDQNQNQGHNFAGIRFHNLTNQNNNNNDDDENTKITKSTQKNDKDNKNAENDNDNDNKNIENTNENDKNNNENDNENDDNNKNNENKNDNDNDDKNNNENDNENTNENGNDNKNNENSDENDNDNDNENTNTNENDNENTNANENDNDNKNTVNKNVDNNKNNFEDEINKDLCIKSFYNLMVPSSDYFSMYFETKTGELNFGSGNVLKLSLNSRYSFENLLSYQDRLDPNKADKFGNNNFTYASFISPLAVDALQRLKNADINQQNSLNGMTALMYACIFQPESIQTLLENEKIDVNIKDFEGKTAFDHIVDRYDLDIEDDFEQPTTREDFKAWIDQIQDYLSLFVIRKTNHQWSY